jgi:protein-tyrosine-phosphatase
MKQTILFLCPHNAAKSVIAAAYFNQFADEKGLPFIADSAGTEPSDSVSPVVAAMMQAEGLDVSQFKPRHVTPEDYQTAARVISIGCTPEELKEAGTVEYWDDVLMVSQNPEGSRDAIRTHVTQLISELDAVE